MSRMINACLHKNSITYCQIYWILKLYWLLDMSEHVLGDAKNQTILSVLDMTFNLFYSNSLPERKCNNQILYIPIKSMLKEKRKKKWYLHIDKVETRRTKEWQSELMTYEDPCCVLNYFLKKRNTQVKAGRDLIVTNEAVRKNNFRYCTRFC